MMSEENRRRLPGFTAEDSLYRTGGRYQLAAQWSVSTEGHSVIPALVPMECTNCTCTGDLCNCEKCVLT
jgi:hypothetical protein